MVSNEPCPSILGLHAAVIATQISDIKRIMCFMRRLLLDANLQKVQKSAKKSAKDVWNLKISAIFAPRKVKVTAFQTPFGV
jgi:hypothetical protein